jgi:ATP-binding cassette subfamily C protein CydCD
MTSSVSEIVWLVELARPQQWRLVASVLLGAAAAAASVALMGTAAYLISRASQQPPVLTLTVAIVAVRFFGISRAVSRYAERLVGHDAAFRVVSDLRVSVYRRIEPLVPGQIGDRSSGDILTRFAVDVDTVSDAYLRVFPPFAIAGLVGTGAVLLLTFMDPWVGFALAVGLIIGLTLVPRVVTASVARGQTVLTDRRTRHSDQVLEMLEVLPETWVADTTEPFVERVRAERNALLDAELRVARGAGLGQSLGLLVAGLTVVACLALGAAAVSIGDVDGVLLGVLVLTPLAAFDLMTPLPDAVRRWKAVTSATVRIRELLEAEPERQELAAQHPHGDVDEVEASRVSSENGVELHNVSVRWPGAPVATLHEVSLVVPSAGCVAVVGPSGSGKSTLAMTLSGFLFPEHGSVQLGGADTESWDDARRHATVGLLEQRPYLFDTTVIENLLIARPDASRGAVDESVRRVGLSSWMTGLPRGLDTPVGEHGRQLSGGQRQRLGLARLLLADHPIVVLDEPDEHLDALSADALLADLLGAARGRTTVVISHRLVPLAKVDHIVVLDAGRVIEDGTHGALVARGGWYARTWMREQEIAAAVAAAAASS